MLGLRPYAMLALPGPARSGVILWTLRPAACLRRPPCLRSFIQVGYVKAEAVRVVQLLLRKYPQWRREVLPSLQRCGEPSHHDFSPVPGCSAGWVPGMGDGCWLVGGTSLLDNNGR